MIEVDIIGAFTGYPKGVKTEFKPGRREVDETYFRSVLEPKGLAKKVKAKKESAPDAED